MTESRKARANRQAQEIIDAHRKEQGKPPEPKKKKKPSRDRWKKAPHKEAPRHRTEEQTNTKGEKVLKQFGTTKASKRNPVRLSDGKAHPVTVRYAEPRAPKPDTA